LIFYSSLLGPTAFFGNDTPLRSLELPDLDGSSRILAEGSAPEAMVEQAWTFWHHIQWDRVGQPASDGGPANAVDMGCRCARVFD